MMEYRHVGKWGVKVSSLGLGSYLTIGYKCSDATSRELVKIAYDNGINFFDTANAYNKGQAEKVLGRCLKDYPRSSVFLLTKVFAPMGTGPNDCGLSYKHIFEQCHASLKRLGMDYVDVYMCHRPDPETPLEETVRAMEDLARQGKILYWGISEWPSTLIVEAQSVARSLGARPMSVSQPRYNLLHRYPESDLFPITDKQGIGNVTFSPLAHGMLTGKYVPGERAARGTRAADPDQNTVMMKLYWKEENKKRAQRLVKLAGQMGVSAAQLVVAWCLRRPEVSSVILGARKISQLKENLKAAQVKIPRDVLDKLDKLYPPVGGVPGV